MLCGTQHAGGSNDAAAIHEERLEVNSSAAGAAEALALGDSIIVIPSFASPAECGILLDAAYAVVKYRRIDLTSPDELYLPNLVRLHIARRLNACARAVSDTFIARAMALIESELGAAANAFFGAGVGLADPDTAPLVELSLKFSPGEPAINIYSEGGEFLPHEDGSVKTLTLLVPLSDSGTYEGGGTGFYPGGAAVRRQHQQEAAAAALAASEQPWEKSRRRPEPEWMPVEPSLVVRASAGSAVLFGGEVTHAGMPLRFGTRFVFVASFRARDGQATQSVESQLSSVEDANVKRPTGQP